MTYTYNPKLAKDAAAWDFMYGKNTPAHPKQNYAPDGTNAGFKFDIPPYPAQVDYLMHEPAGLAIPGGIRVDLRIVATSGKPQFIPDPGSTPYSGCRIACILQRDGDDLTMAKEDYRYWCGIRIPLVPTDASAPIATWKFPVTDLTKWSNVDGKSAADRGDAFPTLLKNLWRVGLTFGGGTAYAGHGVSVINGTCRIYVYRYSAY